MFGWGGGGDGPRTKREFRAAYSILSDDVIGLHGELGRVRLDNVRIEAMVRAMAQETAQVRAELAGARADFEAARAEVRTDPMIGVLADHTYRMREQLDNNQQAIATLTERLTQLIEVQVAAAARPPASVTELPSNRVEPVADLRRAEPAAVASPERLRVLRRAQDG